MIYKKVIIILITILYLWSLANFVKVFVADAHYTQSQKNLRTGEIEKALEKSEKSIRNNPSEPRYYYERAKILLTSSVSLEDTDSSKIKEAALKNLQKAETLNPKNLTTLRNSVPIYYYLAIKDLVGTPSKENIDLEYLETTKEFFQKVKQEYSNDAGVQVLVAKYEKRLFLEQEYEETVEQIKQLRPDLLEWYLVN